MLWLAGNKQKNKRKILDAVTENSPRKLKEDYY